MPWRLESLDEEWADSRLRGIVAFRIRIERMEATFRLMQNRTREDHGRVADALGASDDTNAKAVAALMRHHPPEQSE